MALTTSQKIDWLNEVTERLPDARYLTSLLITARDQLRQFGLVQTPTREKLKKELEQHREVLDDLTTQLDLL